jgi:hypothetical protein
MSAIHPEAAGISRSAEQMRQYLRWVAPATLVAAPAIAGLAFYYPVPLLIVLASGTFGVVATVSRRPWSPRRSASG